MAPQTGSNPGRPPVHRLIAAQAAIAALAVLVSAALGGGAAALAAAAGGLTAVLPQAWFAWRVFRRGVIEGGAGAMLRAMYLGEAVKLAAIAVLFVGIFQAWPEVPPLPLLLTFVAVQAVHWFAPLLLET